MFKIVYSLYDKDLLKENVCGFELGYILFKYSEDDEICNDFKNQPSMIFLTITDLILSLVDYEVKKLGFKEIIGADSSLSIQFKRINKFTKIIINGSFSITIETKEVLKEVYYSSVNFCKEYYSFLLTSVRHDLDYALNEIKKMI